MCVKKCALWKVKMYRCKLQFYACHFKRTLCLWKSGFSSVHIWLFACTCVFVCKLKLWYLSVKFSHKSLRGEKPYVQSITKWPLSLIYYLSACSLIKRDVRCVDIFILLTFNVHIPILDLKRLKGYVYTMLARILWLKKSTSPIIFILSGICWSFFECKYKTLKVQ